MKKFLIIIPFHNPWLWHTDYANQTAIHVSRRHTTVCFLWGDAVSLREIIIDRKPYLPVSRHNGMLLYQPLYLIPGKRSLATQYINLFINLIAVYILCSIMALYQKRTLLFWCFGIYDPAFLLLPRFFRTTKTVYDCVDTPSHPDPTMTTRLQESEALLIKNAWIVTANSHVLRNRLLKSRSDIHLVPMGFRDNMFHRPTPHPLPFSDKKPVIGFIGAIDYRLDFPLLTKLVTENTKWNFAIIGPLFYDHMTQKTVQLMHELLKKPNVYHAKVSAREVPSILSQSNVTIIPYRSNLTFNRHAFPMKTMEYLYAKKRVVSSNVIELKQYHPLILLADTPREWKKMIRYALASPLTQAQRRKARLTAEMHTWKKKTDTLLRILAAS